MYENSDSEGTSGDSFDRGESPSDNEVDAATSNNLEAEVRVTRSGRESRLPVRYR